jgi:NitT/TauT family transport system ATP-binding protein
MTNRHLRLVEDKAALQDGAPLIRVAGLEKRFTSRHGEDVVALTGIDLEVRRGEFLSVVGPSGCGKSTLMRIVAGLLGPTKGNVSLAGRPVTGPSNDVGIVFQAATLLAWRTVIDNAMLPAQLQKLDPVASRARVERLLNLVGLDGFERKYPFELSGGMQQRVAICRALSHDPSILLMDEPFGALDAMTREQMNLELMRIWSDEQKTVVFITHSIPEAVFLGDRVVVMTPRPGRIARIIEIELPRPRTLATLAEARFGELCGKIRALLAPSIPGMVHL